jgi:hypothetical protein
MLRVRGAGRWSTFGECTMVGRCTKMHELVGPTGGCYTDMECKTGCTVHEAVRRIACRRSQKQDLRYTSQAFKDPLCPDSFVMRLRFSCSLRVRSLSAAHTIADLQCCYWDGTCSPSPLTIASL